MIRLLGALAMAVGMGLVSFTATAQQPQKPWFAPDRVLVPPANPTQTPTPQTSPQQQQQTATPQQILMWVIQQLQTGTPNPNWYGPALWQTIVSQTNNTGYYPALAQLGSVRDIQLLQQQPMPNGGVYGMMATHQNGKSTWYLAISNQTHRIEYGNFMIGDPSAPIPPAPAAPQPTYPVPSPPTPTPPGPVVQAPAPTQPAPPTGGDATTEACKKFPNLC